MGAACQTGQRHAAQRVSKFGQPLREAIAYVNKALDKRGLTFFDEHDSQARHLAVALTLGVSFEQLSEPELQSFNELAVFPEDVNIPFVTLERYWGLDDLDTEALCERYARLSLLLDFDLNKHTIRLHDVIRTYLNDAQRDRLAELHQRLLDKHRPPPSRPDPSSLRPPVVRWANVPPDEPYLWDHLAYHLIAAGRGDELVGTVKDWRYLAAKTLLRKSLAVEADLLAAEKIEADDDPLRLLRRNFVNSSHLLNRCANERDIEATLFSRLQHLAELDSLIQDMRQHLKAPFLAPASRLPDLPHPAVVRTLTGHSSDVRGCALSADGTTIVSASWDKTLKVWDGRSGQERFTLTGHADWVSGCALSADGTTIVSASWDKTLRVWDGRSGECLATFYTDGPLYGCACSQDAQRIVTVGARGVYFLRLVR